MSQTNPFSFFTGKEWINMAATCGAQIWGKFLLHTYRPPHKAYTWKYLCTLCISGQLLSCLGSPLTLSFLWRGTGVAEPHFVTPTCFVTLVTKHVKFDALATHFVTPACFVTMWWQTVLKGWLLACFVTPSAATLSSSFHICVCMRTCGLHVCVHVVLLIFF